MQPKRLGLEICTHRYSTPCHLKGSKLSTENMNRTMKMKFRKIDQIRTARSQLELYSLKEENELLQNTLTDRSRVKTYTRVLKGRSSDFKRVDFNTQELHVEPAQPIEQKKIEKPRPIYHSSNLKLTMNRYLNSLINKSEQDHKIKLKEFEELTCTETPIRKTSYNTHNLFWKKMKRAISHKKDTNFIQENSFALQKYSARRHV